jgi:hypothetical protein
MAGINQYPMPPRMASLATAWAFLEEGIDHIITKLQTGVSYAKYMSLYTVAYNYCTSSGTPSNTSESPAAGQCLSVSSPSGYLVLTYPFSRC